MKPAGAPAPGPGMAALDPARAPATRTQDPAQQRQMQSRLALLLNGIDHINDSVLMIRAPEPSLRSARVVLANTAFERQTGFAREQIVGRRLPALKGIVGVQLFSHMRRHIAGVRDGSTHRLEFLMPRRDGSSCWIELDISSLADAHEPGTRYWIAVGRDITERKHAERQIHQLAFFDSLTQLPNRQLLLDRLRMALASADRSGRKGALIFMDLDKFKILNDTRGHALGDLLLQQIARRLSARLREGDTVARLGGDEFVVLLPDVAEDAQEAARRVYQIASDLLAELVRPFDLDGYQYHGTASLGITGWGTGNHNAGEILKQADMAMYRAKGAGGNRIAFFDPEAQLALNHRAALTHELRAALHGGEQFVLHYQPQFNSTRQVIGAEALLRWQHPTRGLLGPDAFIPLAEDSGLIVPLGQWVLERACAQLATWAQSPRTASLNLSVNVSARQFRDPGFVQQVLDAVARHQVPPRRLHLELTESLFIGHRETTLQRMRELQEHHISLSLDDFGTGYSSLAYLKHLPLAQLKIDRSFVSDIVTDAGDVAIARTVIDLGQSLAMAVIAEGVETEEQFAFLSAGGCELFQGYLLARPMPVQALQHLLEQDGYTAP